MQQRPSLRDIINRAIILVYQRRSTITQALLIPFLLLLLLDAVYYLEVPQYAKWLLYVPSLAVYTIFAITTHRIILLGINSVPKWGLRKWTSREVYFFLHLAALTLVCVGLFFTGLIAPFVGVIFGIIGSSYLFLRLSLVFPASAIDEGVTFKTSWALTKKHQLLMFYIILFVPIFFGAPAYLVKQITDAFWVISIIDTFATIFVVSCLSLTYSEICNYEYGS